MIEHHRCGSAFDLKKINQMGILLLHLSTGFTIKFKRTVSKSKSVKDGDDYKITVDKNKVITKIVLED